MDTLEKRIHNLKEVIRKTPSEVLQDRVYTGVANFCILLTSYKHEKGAKGWCSKLLDSKTNKPMLNSHDQEVIEETFAKAPWLLELLNEDLNSKESDNDSKPSKLSKFPQVGGSGSWMPYLKTAGSGFIKSLTSGPVNELDISLDTMLDGFIKKTAQIDSFFEKVAYESPGFVKVLDQHQDFNYMGHRIPIKPIIKLLMIILDSIRLSASLMGLKSSRAVKILNIIVFLEELISGEWRQMLLTSVGFFTPSGIAISIIAKYIVNAWMLINPELRTQLFKDMLKGGKSALLGFLLWAGTSLSPDYMRASIEKSLEQMRAEFSTIDDKIKEIQEEGSRALGPMGKKMDFRGVDLSYLRRISFQDIQNLQSLAQWDLIICSSEFQDIKKRLIKSPVFRLIIELLNIPTLDDDTYKMCGPMPYRPIKKAVEYSLRPDITTTVENISDPFANFGKESESEEDMKEVKVESEAKIESEEPEAVEEVEAKAEEPKVKAEEPVEEAEEPKVKAEEPVEEAEAEEPKLENKNKNKNKNKNSQKGGKRLLKLKKSTRYRKATPRRTTRRS